MFCKMLKIIKTYTNFLVYEKSSRIYTAMSVQHLLYYYTCRQGIDIVVRMLSQHCLWYSGQLVKSEKLGHELVDVQ